MAPKLNEKHEATVHGNETQHLVETKDVAMAPGASGIEDYSEVIFLIRGALQCMGRELDEERKPGTRSPCGTLLGSGNLSTKDSGGCCPEHLLTLVASSSDSVGRSRVESRRWWQKATTSTSIAIVFADWECAWVCLATYFTLKQNSSKSILSHGEDERVWFEPMHEYGSH